MMKAVENETTDKNMGHIVPYNCVYIDAKAKNFHDAIWGCLSCQDSRARILQDIKGYWSSTDNPSHVLPCLSVRSGFDLYLRVMAFPPGSEVIMSAVNIPDMVAVVKHHKLKIVPWDISIDTTEPKLPLLPSLISDKTVAIVIAHIFGKWCDIDPVIDVANQYGLPVIEDCAEAFYGFENLGNPRADISLFSFGIIKLITAFGGAIVKVRDEDLFKHMLKVYESYVVQSRTEYLKKVLKVYMANIVMGSPFITHGFMYLARLFGIDHKALFMKMLRGFPAEMLQRIKTSPSTPLLLMMRRRFQEFSQSEYDAGQMKCEYVRTRLPDEAQLVGMKAKINNFWLFPILVESPDTVLSFLNAMGVDAYRGATQLNIIEPEGQPVLPISPLDQKYPAEARYMIDHIIYLPVHKDVPFHALNKICKAVKIAIKLSKDAPRVRLQSKL